MPKILDGDFIIPDMRKKRTYMQLAEEILVLNETKILGSYNNIKQVSIGFDKSPAEFLANELKRTELLSKTKLTQKQIVEKTLNTTFFTSEEDRYKRNVKQMLKTSGLNEELRKLRGWRLGNPKTDEFEYDASIGRLVFAGQWVIDHDEDYFVEDGIRIIPIEDYKAFIW